MGSRTAAEVLFAGRRSGHCVPPPPDGLWSDEKRESLPHDRRNRSSPVSPSSTPPHCQKPASCRQLCDGSPCLPDRCFLSAGDVYRGRCETLFDNRDLRTVAQRVGAAATTPTGSSLGFESGSARRGSSASDRHDATVDLHFGQNHW